MGSQSLVRNTTFLYFRMIVVLGVSLFTTRLILDNLGIEDYGIYNVVGSIVSLFTFLQAAISSANYTYLAFAIGKEDNRLVAVTFRSALFLSFYISLIIVVLAETVGLYYVNNYLNVPDDRFEAALYTFQISVVTCVITTLYMPFYSNVIAHEKMDFFAYLSIIEAFSKIAIAVLISYAFYDRLVFYAALLLISQICILLAYVFFSLKEFPETIACLHCKLEKSLFKKMASFSGWTLFVAAADLFVIQGINIVINLFFTPVVNAARGVAVQIQGAVDQFRGNLQTAFNPQITKRYASANQKGMFYLMGCSARYSSFVLLLISLPIIFATTPIISLWLKEVPDYTVSFIRIVLIASVIDGISNPFVTAIGATGHVRKFQTCVGVIKFLTLPACYWGAAMYDSPVVIFLIYLLFTVISVLVRIGICAKSINMRIQYIFHEIFWPIMKFTLTGIIICLIIVRFFQPVDISSMAMFIVVVFCCLCALCYVVGLNKSERLYINGFIKKRL